MLDISWPGYNHLMMCLVSQLVLPVRDMNGNAAPQPITLIVSNQGNIASPPLMLPDFMSDSVLQASNLLLRSCLTRCSCW